MESAPIGRWPLFRRFRRLSRAIAQKFALQDEMLHKPGFLQGMAPNEIKTARNRGSRQSGILVTKRSPLVPTESER